MHCRSEGYLPLRCYMLQDAPHFLEEQGELVEHGEAMWEIGARIVCFAYYC